MFAATARVALEALGCPAFVIRRSGTILLANNAGRALAESDRAALEAELRASLEGTGGGYVLHRISGPGVPVHFLAVRRAVVDPRARAVACAQKWKLTPRQTEVLLLLIGGEGNKAIAARLGCAEKTVEIHVGRILSVSGLPGRASVISYLLRSTEGE